MVACANNNYAFVAGIIDLFFSRERSRPVYLHFILKTDVFKKEPIR